MPAIRFLAASALLGCCTLAWTAEPTPPEKAAETFRLPEGLTLELVASEPLVVDPVAISFDQFGRMFVAEYRDYPLGPGEGKPPLSRIRLLEDTDGDGRMDVGHTFVDELSFAQGVLAWRGGVLVTAAPNVWFFRDTDGDHRADEKTLLFTGFKPGNPQLRVAHPRRALDNWVYMTNGLSGGEAWRPETPDNKVSLSRRDFRFHPSDMRFESTTGNGQFGNTFDDDGNRFFCSNRNPTMYAVLTQHAVNRNPFALIGTAYEDVAPTGGDAKVYPLTEAKTTAFSHAGTHTAACGVHVYRGDLLGSEYAGDVFVCEPTGNLVTQSNIAPQGVSFRVTRARPKLDFLASTDSWSRPVSLADGPDGALYVVDMYREVIEHPQYMPAGLAETLNLRSGDDRGRIYRIRPADAPRRKFTPPKTTQELVALLSHPSGWQRDLGQRLIVEGLKDGAAAELAQLAQRKSPSALHALWTLEGLGALTPEMIGRGLHSADPHVVEHCVRLAAEAKRYELLKPLAAQAELPPRVRFQLLIALGDCDDPDVGPLLAALAAPVLEDAWMGRALLTSVRVRAADVFAALQAADALAGEGAVSRIELITQLAGSVGARGELSSVGRLLDVVVDQPDFGQWWQTAALTGLAQGLSRHRGELGRTSLGKLLADPPAEIAGAAAKARKLLAQSAKLAVDEKRPVADRVAAIRLLAFQPFDTADPVLRTTLTGTQPISVQLAALEAIRAAHYREGTELVLAAWSTLSPQARATAIDVLLARTETTTAFLEAMAAGKVPPNVISFEGRNRLQKHRDAAVKKLANELFGGPVSANRKAVVEEYRKALTAASDATRGQAVFKKICAACHRVRDLGHAIGPDITDVRNKTRETLLYDILDPNRAVEPRWVSYVVITSDGRALNGLLASESATGIVLRRAEGKEDVLARSEIDEMSASGKSLMPEGVEKDITVEQMGDLLEFLKQGR